MAEAPARRTVEVPPGPDGHPPRLVVDVYPAAEPRGAVLAAHGLGSSRRGGKAEVLGRTLPAAGWTVLAPDFQGHGASGGALESLSIARSVADVRRVAAQPEFAQARHRVFAGSSFGALVVAWAAAEDAALCERLVLLAPAFGFLERYVRSLPKEALAAWRAGAPHVPAGRAGQAFGPDVLAEVETRSTARLAAALAHPALVVHGRADESVPWDAAVEFARACPRRDLDLVLLGGADHRLTGRGAEIATLVLRFLSAC